MAAKLDPELASGESAADSKENGSSRATTVTLLDGKLKLDISSDFSRDPDDPKEPKTVAEFSARTALGERCCAERMDQRRTSLRVISNARSRVQQGLQVDAKGFPHALGEERNRHDRRSQMGRLELCSSVKGKEEYSHNPAYTRNLTTSYKGQLLEINFSSNLNTSPELKKEIDHIMDSVHLEE